MSSPGTSQPFRRAHLDWEMGYQQNSTMLCVLSTCQSFSSLQRICFNLDNLFQQRTFWDISKNSLPHSNRLWNMHETALHPCLFRLPLIRGSKEGTNCYQMVAFHLFHLITAQFLKYSTTPKFFTISRRYQMPHLDSNSHYVFAPSLTSENILTSVLIY